MQLQIKTVRQGINKAFLKEPVERPEFNNFKSALSGLLDQIDHAVEVDEHEEHLKNLLPPFFKTLGFDNYKINTSGRIDLAIYTGTKKNDPVSVLMEVKRPGNKAEMITRANFNKKALHEAVLYYLEQRIEEENTDLKHVIITNMHDWFIFDAQEFERCFFKPSALKKTWKSWKADQKVSSNNDFMYSEIAKFVANQDTSISGLHIPLDKARKLLAGQEDSAYEKKLIPLFKLFTPIHLLKESFANDSNSLNKEFYRELLYILGLEETTEGSTRYIRRASEENRNPGSLVENTIRILDAEDHLSRLNKPAKNYGENKEDQLFGVALELCITWMNRVLFLKLLEAQLFRYHRGDRKFKFLNSEELYGFDALNTLFFQVLARRTEERSDAIKEKFGHIPYLNSSLFDVSDLEHETTRISGITDTTMPVYNRSVLNELRGNERSTLGYLFEFLEAFDFAAEGKEEIRSERKSLINASVLGLIFEKINGYKDGSFYTPGFITEYMARETLRKAVVDKFKNYLYPNSNTSPSALSGRETDFSQSDEIRGRVRAGGVATGSSHPHPDSEQAQNHPSARQRERENIIDIEINNDRVEEVSWKVPDELIERARELRQNQTQAEEFLWQLLRGKNLLGYKFRRQHPLKEGMILDFYCAKEKLAVELDGGYHDAPEQKEKDENRTDALQEKQIRVIRFKNEDLLEYPELVLNEIARHLQNDFSPSTPGGRETDFSQGDEIRGRVREMDEGSELTFKDLYNHIGPNRSVSIEEANEIVNSITICDPAVGSGHFLVSCLNELLAVKSDLGILCDVEGKAFRDLKVMVENDELIISFGDDELFEYDVSHTWQGQKLTSRNISPERQRVQQALFHEKKYLIENCLFGVDINANSVKICRLRLWIELLKRAFYTAESECLELEVLPNIDINIKQGNSLVSRFELDSDLSSVFKDSDHSLEDYKEAVRNYKHSGNRSEKQRLQKLIAEIKEEYTTTLTNIRPINKKLSRERGKLELMQNADLFGDNKFTQKEIKKQKKKVKKLEAQKAEEESGAFYNQAFEWRFEFPEVLDEEGMFVGFDLIIANPPYIPLEGFNKIERDFFRKKYNLVERKFDTSILFLFEAFDLSKHNAPITFIAPVTWETGENYKKLRKYLFYIKSVDRIINLPFDIFEDAYVETGVFIFSNSTSHEYQIFNFRKKEKIENLDNLDFTTVDYDLIVEPDFKVVLDPFWARIINRFDEVGFERFGEITFSTQGLSGSRFEKKLNKTDEFHYPFLNGGQVYNYQMVIDEITYTSLNDKLNLEKFYQAEPKLLIRRIVNRRDRLDVGYTEEKLVVKKDINPFIVDDRRFNPKYVLGIMASKFISAMYVNTSSIATKDDFRQTTLTELRHILIPIADEKDQGNIVKLADQILTAKKENPEADTSELEAEIDRLVYELYGLSEEEIGIVEGSV